MIPALITLWPLLGMTAWIFMLWAVNRRYNNVHVDSWPMFWFMMLFIVIGPIAWFPAFILKALSETE